MKISKIDQSATSVVESKISHKFSLYKRITTATLRYRSLNDMAYIGNFWADLLSTTLYVVTFVLFVELLFRRIGGLGGYSKDDFLFITFIGQFTYYIYAHISMSAATQLVDNVRTGAFDFMLLRPLSTRFNLYISAIRPVLGLFVSLPNLVLFLFIIDWSNISINLSSFVSGLIVWICAMIVLNTIVFSLVMPVFTQGDATDMITVSYALFSICEIPFNLLPSGLKFASFIVLPTVLATGGAGFVMLQKGNSLYVLLGSVLAAVVAVLCFNILWKKALNNYSSASS